MNNTAKITEAEQMRVIYILQYKINDKQSH